MIEKFSPNIFLSSTYLDLKSEREIAMKAINKNFSCKCMENWDSSYLSSKEKILELLNKSAGVVLILGFKYGSIDDDEKISITEFEYKIAKELGLPILAFIKNNENDEWENLEEDDYKKDKLNIFKEMIDEELLRSTFKTEEELERKIISSLNDSKDAIYKNSIFSEKWFENNLEYTIENLGTRYTPELNFKLELDDIFNGISKNKEFLKKFNYKIKKYYCKLNSFNNLKNKNDNFNEMINELKNEIKGNSIKEIDYTSQNLKLIINSIYKIIINILNDDCLDSNETRELKNIKTETENIKEFLSSVPYKLSENPFLLIKGDAGVGKSHLLADLSINKFKKSEMTIFLLGSYFNTEENPFKQILHQLDIDSTIDEFLESLNFEAETQKSRILIIIDAINEGKGKELWPKYINEFVKRIKNYKWLGLIFSIRTSYLSLFESSNLEKFNIYKHAGFGSKTSEAIKMFCKYYSIDFPSFPILNPEFENPLFLRVLFESISKNNNSEILQENINFSNIFELYMKTINESVSKKINVSEDLKIIPELINRVIKFKLDNGNDNITYKNIFRISVELEKEYNIKNNLIPELIHENIFFKENNIKNEENIYFTYERFENHLIISFLLNNIKKENLNKEFRPDGRLFFLIKDYSSFNYNKGLIESLAIQIPEKYNKEIFEIKIINENLDNIEKNLIKNGIAECFIYSLIWRNDIQLNSTKKKFIHNLILKNNHLKEEFLNLMILLIINPYNFFNSYDLHNKLFNMTLPERDAKWTIWINKNYFKINNFESSIYRIINWILLNDNPNYSKEYLESIAITLSWFLTSSNRELRDKSTYALINLLKDNVNILKNILKKFENVNDPYIYERLFAVAYGSVLKSSEIDYFEELGNYIYKTIFLKETIYPHILLRDYAKNTIEFINKKVNLNIDLNKIKPPYKTEFPIIPSDEELKTFYLEYNYNDDDDLRKAQNYILNSMELEYDRNGKNKFYGDFGRYVFQSKFHYWKEVIDIHDLKNIAIKLIFELGYDYKIHGEYDILEQNKHWDRHYQKTERIGKKYQWIALYKLLAYVSDNFKLNDIWFNEKSHFLRGPWEIYARNFDPSLNFKDQNLLEDYYSNYYNFSHQDSNWIKTIDDIPNIEDIINLNFKKDISIFEDLKDINWVLLFGNYDWKEEKTLNINDCENSQKDLWIEIQSFIVHQEDLEIINKSLKEENLFDDILPFPLEFHQVYEREYVWSETYKEIIGDMDIEELNKYSISNEKQIEITNTIDDNNWESQNYIFSNTYNRIIPTLKLYKGINLKYGNHPNILYSPNKEPITFDLSNFFDTNHKFFINKTKLIEFLDMYKYTIIWKVIGRKRILKGLFDYDMNNELSFYGVYYFNENYNIKGNLKF